MSSRKQNNHKSKIGTLSASAIPHPFLRERCIRHAEGTKLNNFDVVNYHPEPATATLSLLALAALAARRRR